MFELKGRQKDILALSPMGHNVVLGAAGSGKTTLAVYRAELLANIDKESKVLLLTYNTALISYMKTLTSGQIPKNIIIEHYHKFARGYLNSLGKMKDNCIIDRKRKEKLISEAVADLRNTHKDNSTFKRSDETFFGEIKFIQEFGVASLGEYEEIERIGRASTNIKRENRKYFYKVYGKYKELRNTSGYKYDWEDIAYYVNEELKKDKRKKIYKHVIVDEGQDFSPMMLKSLINLIPEDGSFIFFGDVAQQIYGSRLSWRNAGIKIKDDHIWKFENNYRNTKEILEFSKDLIKSEFWRTKVPEDLISSINPKAAGPKPVLKRFDDQNAELLWLLDALKEFQNSLTVVVLRTWKDLEFMQKYLSSNNVQCHVLSDSMNYYGMKKMVFADTYHSVKGIEFENVFLPFLNKDTFPDVDKIKTSTNIEDAWADELKLLYVAVTRAKQNLIMTYNGQISPLFPEDSSNYDKR